MKKKYLSPAIETVKVSGTPLLVLSGGGKGEEGDHAENRRFWGTTVLDEVEEDSDNLVFGE